jgi:hypothetical protein
LKENLLATDENSLFFDYSQYSEISQNKSVEYIHSATSDNTRKAYQSDIDNFVEWGGSLPTNPEQLVSYFTDQAPLKILVRLKVV